MKNFPGGMQQFMRQAQQMQLKMAKLQEELALKTVEGTSGGGAVTATATGANLVSAIKINKEVIPAVLYPQGLISHVFSQP